MSKEPEQAHRPPGEQFRYIEDKFGWGRPDTCGRCNGVPGMKPHLALGQREGKKALLESPVQFLQPGPVLEGVEKPSLRGTEVAH